MYGSHIIIADSDTMLQKKLKLILTKAGYSVVGMVEDSLSALKLVRSRDPDLIILDANLPGTGGFEVAKIIGESRIAPVVMLISHYQKEQIQKCKDSWIFAYVVKPVNEDNLLSSIEIALLNYQKMLSLENQVKELKETLESRKIVEKAKGLLMKHLGLSEAEAFKKIQKQSMNKRTSMKAIAEAVILAYELKDD